MLLADHLNIQVIQDDDGVTTTATGPFGPTLVEAAVASWLGSDEGQALRPKLATHDFDGRLQAEIRKLRSKLN
jgi:hypothetical protein